MRNGVGWNGIPPERVWLAACTGYLGHNPEGNLNRRRNTMAAKKATKRLNKSKKLTETKPVEPLVRPPASWA